MSDKWRRRIAGGLAALTFVLVLSLSLILLLVPVKRHWDVVWDDDPFSTREVTTTVTKTTGGAKGDRAAVTTTKQTGTQTKRVTAGKGRTTEVTKTTGPAEASFVERTLGEGGLLIGRVALAVIASFLAAGIVQRVVLSHYSVKIGTLEFNDLPGVAGDVKKGLEDLTKLAAELKDGLAKESERGQGTADKLTNVGDSLLKALGELEQRVAALEK